MKSRLLILPLAAALLAGCTAANPSTSSSSDSSAPVKGTVTVLAAASLTGTFTTLAKQFEAAHPGVTVTLSFGGSDTLAAQINSGAPADVFASASDKTMATVTDAGNGAAAPVTIATNVLEIAVPTDNPGKVTGIADFANKKLSVVICAAAVPCGAAAAKVFTAEKITPSVDDYEQDVKSVLTKVELGEADAGLVYKTDVLAAGSKVTGIEFPQASDAVTDYPIVALKDAPNPTAAQAFVAYVTGSAGTQVLSAAGFGAP